MLESGQPDAVSAFEPLVRAPNRDPLAEFHFERIQSGKAGTTVVMTEKQSM